MSDLQTSPIDSVKARRFVSEIDRCFDELDSERGSYMSRCKGIRERIKDWKDQAEASGIPRRGLNHLLKRREIESKLKAHEDDAEEEIRETADMIDVALGGEKGLAGSPLGAAAGGKEADEEVRGEQQRKREAERKAGAEKLLGMTTPEEGKKARERKRSDALDDLAARKAEGRA